MMKFCNGCKTEKPFSDFSTRKAAPDGLKPQCRPCTQAYERYRFHRNPEITKARTAAIYQKNKDRLKEKRDKFKAENPKPPRIRHRLPDDERAQRKKESRKRTYEKNKEKVLAQAAIYRAAHKEQERTARKLHYERNLQRAAELGKAYRQANKGKVAAWQRNYQARKRQAIPSWANLEKIAEIYETAAWLTKESGEEFHVDHIVPLQGKTVCGLHCEANLTLLPAGENISKSNRYWPDMW